MFVKFGDYCVDWDNVRCVRSSGFANNVVIEFNDGAELKCPYVDYNSFMTKLKQENIIKVVDLDA